MPSPAATDLCALADVKTLLKMSPSDTSQDTLLQGIITDLGVDWLQRTSRDTICQPLDFTETYDGHGGYLLFPRNWPINSVTSLSINGSPVVASIPATNGGTPTFGYVISSNKRWLSLVGQGSFAWNFGGGANRFARGTSNIVLSYNAGNNGIPADIYGANLRQVAILKDRQGHQDEKMTLLPQQGGTTSYRDWEFPPEIMRVIDRETSKVPRG